MRRVRAMRAWLVRALSLARANRLDREFREELESHLRMHVDDNVRAGMTRDEARRHALARLGGLAGATQRHREQRGIPVLEHLARDVRVGARSLRRTPGLTVVAIITLGVGIGATTVVFSFANAVFLEPLPIESPGDVVFLNSSAALPTFSYPDYRDLRDRNTVFAGLVACRFSPVVFGDARLANADRAWGYLATGNYFQTLGVPAALGRAFAPDDDMAPGAHPVVVLSDGFWRRRFGADRTVIGRSVQINGRAFTVLGVMPAGFHGTERYFSPDLWVPMMMQAEIEPSNPWLDRRQTRNVFLFGRLAPGVTPSAAEAALNGLAAELAREHPATNDGMRIELSPPGLAGNFFRGAVLSFSGALAAVAALVLLLACTNLTGLLLARATDRQRGVAICLAIGAGRPTLVRQALVESALVSVAATALALALTAAFAEALTSWRLPVDFPLRLPMGVDARVLVYASAMSVVATLLVGLTPALSETRTDLVQTLKGETVRTRSGLPVRDVVLALQMALSLALLFAALLVIRSLQEATRIDVGFNPDGVVTARMDLDLQGYSEPRGRVFQQELMRRLAAQPSIRDVGLTSAIPLSLDQSTSRIDVEGRPPQRAFDVPVARYYRIWPRLFATLQTPLVAGRDFDEGDRPGSRAVAIVNEAFVAQILGPGEPIGRRFRIGLTGDWIEIVGVVRDGKYVSLSEDPVPVVFYAATQRYDSSTVIVARGRGSEEETLGVVRQTVDEIDAALSVYSAAPLARTLDVQMLPFRVAATALTAFGALTLLLVSIGTYALVAYSVARRTREICIRVAVGASASDVVRVILGRTALVWAAGAGAGALLAMAAAPALSPLLLGGARTQAPATFAVASLAVLLVSALACWAPTRRALTSDPAALLRHE